MTANNRIGLMGGTFDPIHYAHLLAAEEARLALNLERVIFLPTGIPPHKRYENMASAEDRYAMTLLATADNPFFVVSRMETERSGISYTNLTLMEIHALYPGKEFFLIIGFDSVLDMPNWRNPLEICRLCTPVVVPRPGYETDKLLNLPSQIREKIYKLDTMMPDISATNIRGRVSRGTGIRYLVPFEVEIYIRKNRIYSTDQQANGSSSDFLG